jgi:hypothetical protein
MDYGSLRSLGCLSELMRANAPSVLAIGGDEEELIGFIKTVLQ